jgi:hypothetical protein
MSIRSLWVCIIAILGVVASASGQDGPVARINQAGDFLDLVHHDQVMKDYLPVHRTVGARYFSAGVGMEERAASYPPFPLKIIFTAGGKPFLSGVTVTIQPAKGGPPLVIPRDAVEGPWLFVDLSPGVYDLTADDGGDARHLKSVKVETGKQKVVYMRWARDYGVASRLPAE